MLITVKKLLFVVGILVLGLILYFVYEESGKQTGASQSLTMYVKGPNMAIWRNPNQTTTQTTYGNTEGTQIQATVTGEITEFMGFENKEELEKQGFSMDNSLAADGAGSSTWGYKRSDDDRTQIITFSYSAKPTSNNPNAPLEFNCPCEIKLTVFLSKPFENAAKPNMNIGLANPASVNCTKVGGTLSIQTLGNGAQYGLCEFEDNMSCEEWALYRGECPVGGVKTTGYDNAGQMYCAWLGGETLAIVNSKCTLPDGTVCPTDALYEGTCPSS